MKTTSIKRVVDFNYEGDFSHVSLKTVGTIGGDSDCNHPTTLTLYIEQMEEVIVDKSESRVTLRFVGGGEFDSIHKAINLLARELNAVYGEPS